MPVRSENFIGKMNRFTHLFEIPGYQVRLLGNETLPALQGLLERCGDYIQLVTGSLPSSKAAENTLADCPPGRSCEDKAVIGVYNDEGSLVGVLDVVRDYPTDDCWWVGLLLVEPTLRSRGLGRRIFQAFEQWVGQLGAKYILLGVVEDNERAFQFWQSLGFEVVEKQLPSQFGEKEHIVITMIHYLSRVKND